MEDDAAAQPPNYAGLIEALINAANTAVNARPQIPDPDPPAPAVFALLPGMSNGQPLDYNKTADMKLFNKGIAGMESKFDLKEGNLHVFLNKFREHARIFNWSAILRIPDSSGTTRDLSTNYGQLTITECQNHATTYVTRNERRAQDSMMMYQYLSNSLTEEATTMILSNKSSYYVNELPSGLCFLKTIIGRASIDTKARVMLLRETVANLHVKINEFNGDVRKFNVFVDQTKEALMGRGESVDELVTHLFRAYEKVNDEEFKRYILTKRDKYDDDGLMTADELMSLAQTKYDLIKHRTEAASLGSNSGSNDKLLALEAELQALKATTTNRAGRNRNRKGTANSQDWKKVKPKHGEAMIKQINRTKYNWCKYHQMWTVHSPDECRLKNETKGEKEKVKDDEKDEQLTMARAYAAIIQSSSD
jgi:hypothetical protein